MNPLSLAAWNLAVLALSTAWGQSSGTPAHTAAAPPSRSPLQTGYHHRFESGVDGGGKISSRFFFARTGVPLIRQEDLVAVLSAAYNRHIYTFDGDSSDGFVGTDPWGEVHTVRLGLPIRWKIDDDWSFFASPSARSLGEGGARFEDTLVGGAVGGLSFRVGQGLTIGPGILYTTQLEDSESVIPIVIVDWKFTDSLSVTTRPSGTALRGPGLAFHWDVSDDARLTVGARYQKLRFRLEEENAASPGGVGEDRTVPVFAALALRPARNWEVSLLGGVGLGNRLSLDDDTGRQVSESDYDSSPFVGLNISLRF